jgi:hypothetical protein
MIKQRCKCIRSSIKTDLAGKRTSLHLLARPNLSRQGVTCGFGVNSIPLPKIYRKYFQTLKASPWCYRRLPRVSTYTEVATHTKRAFVSHRFIQIYPTIRSQKTRRESPKVIFLSCFKSVQVGSYQPFSPYIHANNHDQSTTQ